MTSFVSTFASHVSTRGSKHAFSFLDDSGDVVRSLTYQQLWDKSSKICHHLKNSCGVKAGERVMLVYPPSIDFIVAFIACLLAGIVAVPAFPPNSSKMQKDLLIFNSIVTSSGAKVALTSASYRNAVKVVELKNYVTGAKSSFSELKWETTDALITDDVGLSELPANAETPSLDQLAFLQYTSGSTSEPKGVMISHGNLTHNLKLIISGLSAGEDTVVVSWLPQYHDMGLIGSYLGAIFCGGCGYYMSPFSFIKNPSLWVQCMSQYRATHMQAPNFAYTLTARKFMTRQKTLCDKDKKLDLSCVRHMINAAEPVEAKAIEAFYAVFSPYGLRSDVVYPTYGLAEHTVYVCSNGKERLCVDKEELEVNGNVKVLCEGDVKLSKTNRGNSHTVLMGCGRPADSVGVDLCIVDPEGLSLLGEEKVGEIWIDSPSKAMGYWGLPERSDLDFRAQISSSCGDVASDIDKPRLYLRTGDLGFLHNGELFICGRLKDLIIMRGRNLYPQDVERSCESVKVSPSATTENSDGGMVISVRPGCSAAFSVPVGGQEVLVYCAELADDSHLLVGNDKYYQSALLDTLRSEVRAVHGVSLSVIQLLPPRTIPKTSSGKIARQWVRKAYLEGTLQNAVVVWSELDSIDVDNDFSYLMVSRSGSYSTPLPNAEDDETNGEFGERIDPTGCLVSDIVTVLQQLVGQVVGRDPLTVDAKIPFSAVGLDSMQGIALQRALEARFTVILPDEVLMEPDATLMTLARSLCNGGSFEHRPIMVNGEDVFNAVQKVENKRKPLSLLQWFGGFFLIGDGLPMRPGRSELLPPVFFKEFAVKADVDTLKFRDGSALQPASTPLTFSEDLICQVYGWGVFGIFIWFPLLVVGLFRMLDIQTATTALLGIFGVIYLIPWGAWPPAGRKHWSFRLALKYYNYKAIIEAPIEAYAGVPSIYAYGPHGVFGIAPSMQALVNEFVVGESMNMLGASAVFKVPVYNIMLKLWGFRDVARKSVVHLLTNRRSVGIIPGGIAEMFTVCDENETMVVKDRKGFVKLALETGTQIVPCYCFGNTKTFHTCTSPLLESLSRRLRMSLIVFWGRGGMPIPRSTQLITAVGRPILCPLVKNPSAELVNDYHEKYLRETRRIYDTYKNTIGWSEKKLIFSR